MALWRTNNPVRELWSFFMVLCKPNKGATFSGDDWSQPRSLVKKFFMRFPALPQSIGMLLYCSPSRMALGFLTESRKS